MTIKDLNTATELQPGDTVRMPDGTLATVGAPTGIWSGNFSVPMVGDRVYVRMNALGPGTVRGHFVAAGYLGLEVEIDASPSWRIDQLARVGLPASTPVRVFGAECAALSEGA